jgi:hypothetical protein
MRQREPQTVPMHRTAGAQSQDSLGWLSLDVDDELFVAGMWSMGIAVGQLRAPRKVRA